MAILYSVALLSLVMMSAAAMDQHRHEEELPVHLYLTNSHGVDRPPRHRRSGGGSGASSFASSGASSGSFSGGGGDGFAFPQGFGDNEFQRQIKEFQNYVQQMQAAHNNFDGGVPNGLESRFGGGSFSSGPGASASFSSQSTGGDGGFAFPSSSFSSPGGQHGASATGFIGPQGGYGQADLHGGLGARFGGESAGGAFPASGANGPVGVFTSSSSGSSDINGKKTGFKQATTGVIGADGKVTSYSVRS